MPRLLFIVNPTSGRGRSARVIPRLSSALTKAGHQIRVEQTRRVGHAQEIIRGEAGKWAEGIVSVGGDGTFNEVLNALDDPSRIPIGMIPLGTGNAIAKELGFWNDLYAATDCIARWETIDLDYGETSIGKRFSLMLSAGFDALIIKRLAESRRGTMRMTDYAPLILRESRNVPNYRMRLIIDEIDHGIFNYVNCANFRSCGGPIEFASHACPSDGQFEVVAFKGSLKHAMPMLLVGATLKHFSRIPGVKRFQGRNVQVEPIDDLKVPVQIDGEYAGSLPAELNTHHHAMHLFCPQQTHARLLEEETLSQ